MDVDSSFRFPHAEKVHCSDTFQETRRMCGVHHCNGFANMYSVLSDFLCQYEVYIIRQMAVQ